MSFSTEDKSCWNSSEVMLELEKQNLLKTAVENDWEDEKFEKALEQFEEPTVTLGEEPLDIKEDLRIAYNLSLIDKLEKIANTYAEKSNIKTAYRIEECINEIKVYFKG